MANKFELNYQGVRALMQSEEMQKILKEKAQQALSRLGTGYDSNLHVGRTRANVNVYADSITAKRDNAKYNTILKAVK